MTLPKRHAHEMPLFQELREKSCPSSVCFIMFRLMKFPHRFNTKFFGDDYLFLQGNRKSVTKILDRVFPFVIVITVCGHSHVFRGVMKCYE